MRPGGQQANGGQVDCVICQLDGLLGEWLSETLESETLDLSWLSCTVWVPFGPVRGPIQLLTW